MYETVAPSPDLRALEILTLEAKLRNASSNLEQAHALANRVETAMLNYDKSPESNAAALEIILETSHIEYGVKQLSGVASNSLPADVSRLVGQEPSVRQLEAKQCRQSLNDITKTITELTRARQSRLDELLGKRSAAIHKHRWAIGLATLGAGGMILWGLADLRTEYRNRTKNARPTFRHE